MKTKSLHLILFILFLFPIFKASSEEPIVNEEKKEETVNKEEDEEKEEKEKPFKLYWSGYGEMQFAWFGFGPDQTLAGGSESDSRLVFDLARFALELEGKMIGGIEFEAELEIEHGGTGSAMELDFEEFGEFEQEIEKGGEVNLEVLYLKKEFGEKFSITIGEFYLALGLMSDYHKPTDYLATTRPESETSVIPAVWNEIGLSFESKIKKFHFTLQLVNGLDSTGFSSQYWVASGHQGRFELVNATDLALVGRVDYSGIEGLTIGASAYYGFNTTRNRPQDDLKDLNAPLVILDAHFALKYKNIEAKGLVLWGHLESADEISDRNSRLSNNLDVLRSAVSDEALAIWAEFGIDVAPYFHLNKKHEIQPYFRFDYYDTQFNPRESLFDNPRFEKSVYTLGVSYTFANAVVTKLDFSHRRFGTILGESELNTENSIRLSAGFVF